MNGSVNLKTLGMAACLLTVDGFEVFKFNSDGSPDRTWGKNGVAGVEFPAYSEAYLAAMELDSQGAFMSWAPYRIRALNGTLLWQNLRTKDN